MITLHMNKQNKYDNSTYEQIKTNMITLHMNKQNKYDNST